MEIINLQEKVLDLSNDQLKSIYLAASRISQDSIEELTPILLRVCLNCETGVFETGVLKDELGRVIFHLQKTERLDTRIGLEKLLHGALKVNAKEVFKLLESGAPDARDLSKKIKSIL
jgi:hypothetical protein